VWAERGGEVKMRILAVCDDRKTPQPSEPRKHNTSMEASRMHILYYTNIRMLAWRKADARPNEPHHHLFTQPS